VTGDGVPLEQVSADNADKDAAAAAGDDLDFGMMKKKKKSKKGAFDLEAFEKEIVGDEGGAEKAGGAGGEEDDQVGMVSAVDLRGVESASAWRPCSVLLFAAFTPLTRARGTGRALGGGPGQGAAGA